MNLLAKKINELTVDELESLYNAVGTPDLPYPAAKADVNSNGAIEYSLGILNEGKPLEIYSDHPREYMLGLLYRDMPIPSMLAIQQEAILRRAPDSKNRLLAIFGDAGSGKSHMAKMLASRDSRGAMVVDCGGRYMSDLLFEQVIDFGEDFKTALGEKVKYGSLSAQSEKVMEEEFKGSLVRDSSGKITAIDWSKIGLPKDNESSANSARRAMDMIENVVAKWEGIPSHSVNSIGVRKQPGAIVRAFQEGRELILDEYNKSILDSDDSLQTVLQFLIGELDEAKVENSMKVNGREETCSFTFRREDMKPGFFVTMTGNKETDGSSTHGLSRSVYSRIRPISAEGADIVDWKHRVSQVLTGVPLTTLYALFSDMARDDSEAFSDMLMDIRQIGLDKEAKEKIPLHQQMMIKNFEKTVEAIDRLANFYCHWKEIIDPKTCRLPEVQNEISAKFSDEVAIDFRKVIQDVAAATKLQPIVKDISAGGGLRINFAASVSRESEVTTTPEEDAADFGTRFEKVLLASIASTAHGKPELQKALVKEALVRGIISSGDPENNAKAKQVSTFDKDGNIVKRPASATGERKFETIAELLNQDLFSHVGGSENVEALKQAITRKTGSVIDDVQAERFSAQLKTMIDSANETPYIADMVVLGESVRNPIVQAKAIDSVKTEEHSPEKPRKESLLSVAEFVGSMDVPAMAKLNLAAIFRKAISYVKIKKTNSIDQFKRLLLIVEDRHSSGIGVTTLMLRNSAGEETLTHIFADRSKQKMLIVANDNKVNSPNPNITFINSKAADAEQNIGTALSEIIGNKINEEQLLSAFMSRVVFSGYKTVPEMITKGKQVDSRPVYVVKGNKL